MNDHQLLSMSSLCESKFIYVDKKKFDKILTLVKYACVNNHIWDNDLTHMVPNYWALLIYIHFVDNIVMFS
jgi:hypothetical protein